MRKVVILHPAYWEQAMGGAELQISYLVNELKNHDFEIHFIFEDKGKHFNNNLGINLHSLKKINLKRVFGQRWFLYRRIIIRKLNEIQPDVIYTRLCSSWSGVAALYAKKRKIKHIWAIASDNDLFRIKQRISILKPLDIIENFYIKKAFFNATHILTQNNKQQTDLSEIYHRVGIRINQCGESVSKYEIHKEYDVINVVWIANLKPLKRPELFIELSEKMKHISSVKFIMIGRIDKIYLKMLDEASKGLPNFLYTGELSNQEVNEWLIRSHILVNTSLFEGFSNTFVQAWMRKVVVLSMNSNPDEVLTNLQIGFVCSTIEKIINKLEYLYKNQDTLVQMAENSYYYALDNHGIEKNIPKVISLMS